jgi:hypothetical protein
MINTVNESSEKDYSFQVPFPSEGTLSKHMQSQNMRIFSGHNEYYIPQTLQREHTVDASAAASRITENTALLPMTINRYTTRLANIRSGVERTKSSQLTKNEKRPQLKNFQTEAVDARNTLIGKIIEHGTDNGALTQEIFNLATQMNTVARNLAQDVGFINADQQRGRHPLG